MNYELLIMNYSSVNDIKKKTILILMEETKKLLVNVGIGVDIENINRFRNLNKEKDKLFFNKIYTKNELDYCFSKKNPAQHLAVRFAGKEAVIKALNSIEKGTIEFENIEILNNKVGVPLVKLHNSSLKQLKVKISLSHCDDKAIAFAVIKHS